MTIDDSDYHFMENSLNIQLKLVRDRIEQMQLVEKAIQDTTDAIRSHHAIDWNQMLEPDPPDRHGEKHEKSVSERLQHFLTGLICTAFIPRINRDGFHGFMSSARSHPGMRILELGCGDGALWTDNISLLPAEISVTLSDLSIRYAP